jgi:putative glutamine amidotransferase
MTLIVGVPACSKETDGWRQYAAPASIGDALIGGAGVLPVVLPPVGPELVGVIDRLDGLLLPGSPSNVEPSLYGAEEDLTPGKHDPHRDATTLPLVRAALARGLPVLAICRGIQELNVALGGSLFQKVQEVPERLDHRAGDGELDHLFRLKHPVRLTGQLARMLGATEIMVNSLHQQAIDRLGTGLVVEATAPDGTIEGVRVADATGWAFGVQWHPEWHYRTDAPSQAIFRAFGEACRIYATTLRRAA